MATIEGILLKDGGWRRGWRKRYFKLTKTYFQYYENEYCTSPKGAAVRGTIQNVELVDLSTFHFKVTMKSEIWDLQATNRQELIKWMEALKPNSASQLTKQTNISRPLSQSTSQTQVTSYQPEPVIHEYQPLPQSFTQNPRLSAGGSDGRSSPSSAAASPRIRTISATSLSSNRSTSPVTSVPSHQQNEYLVPTETLSSSPAPPAPPAPPADVAVEPLDFSDDEFLDFEDGTYENQTRADTLTQLATLRREVRNLELSGTRQLESTNDDRVAVNVIPNTPEGTMNNTYSEARSTEKNEVDGGSDSDVSPFAYRRSIKSRSLKATGQVNYAMNVPTRESPEDEEEEDVVPGLGSIKSSAPVTNDHTLQTRDSTNSFLSAPSPPDNSFTTMRLQKWIKQVQVVKKAFVDPEEQELGTLDKYLMSNAACLPKENFTLLQKIGNGAFGEVWKARSEPATSGDTLVAVKCLKEGASDKDRHDFYGEAALLGQFKHANVIALHGVIMQGQSPWIVIEYAENGSLKHFIKKNGATRHSNQLLQYCRDIVRGMRYLSERGYIHRDLAARNVLLTRMEVCKIADFGLSRKLGDDDDVYVSRGGMVAIKWTAPEGVLGASYSSASDIWSCGITMWEVFSDGANPFSGQSNEEAFRMIRKGGRLSKPEKCPPDVFRAMLKCWEANPLERPSFAELDGMLYDPNTDNVEQPLYENTEGFVTYMNLEYENMQDVEKS